MTKLRLLILLFVYRASADFDSPSDAMSDYDLPEVNERCCALTGAKYQLTFEGIWSRATHPRDFPTNEWLLHFSDLIGASHKNDFRFWEEGQVASAGVKGVAEWGSVGRLAKELEEDKHQTRSIFKAGGLWYPDLNDNTSALFCTDTDNHLMSMITMLGPSPDWIVGVSGLELCLTNCSWMEHLIVNLYPWDAGTDSGISYMDPNTPTVPQDPIKRITIRDPDHPRAPFFDPDEQEMLPLARIYLDKIGDQGCSGEDPGLEEAENTEDVSKPECAVGDWTDWSDCSVTCGKGLRMRQREYLMPDKAAMMDCDRQLVSKEMCAAEQPTCGDEEDDICATTDWSEWSSCSATCGKGVRTRSRRFHNRMGRKKCRTPLMEKDICMADKADCSQEEEEENPMCPMTPWSEWSPCSVTCGEGVRERSRILLVSGEIAAMKCGDVSMNQEAPCTGERPTCEMTMAETKEACMMDPEVGPCRGSFPRWFFHPEKLMCVDFTYGGCRGNANNFNTQDECQSTCGPLFTAVTPSPPTESTTKEVIINSMLCSMEPDFGPCRGFLTRWYFNSAKRMCLEFTYGGCQGNDNNFESQQECLMACNPQSQRISSTTIAPSPPKKVRRVKCMVTPWSEWSPCSATCGRAYMEKVRMIKVRPQNGGKPCPRKLTRRKKCPTKPCNPRKNEE